MAATDRCARKNRAQTGLQERVMDCFMQMLNILFTLFCLTISQLYLALSLSLYLKPSVPIRGD